MALPLHRSAYSLIAKTRFPVRYPPAAVEIGPNEVVAVRLRSERGGRRLAGYGRAAHQLALTPALVAGGGSIASAELTVAVREAVQSAGIKPGKASLLIPDSLARVWLVQLPEIPRGQAAILEMIRWKIKKSVPFRIEEGVITWQILSRPSEAEPAIVLVGMIPRTLVAQYEEVMGSVGLKVGLVDLPSFNLFNAYRNPIGQNGVTSGDFAVLNATEAYFTLMLFRGGDLVFYRCKTHAEGDAGSPEERARTFRRELATSLSYYTEKLKGVSLSHTFARIADPALGDAVETLGSLGFGAVEPIDPGQIARLPDGLDEWTAVALAPAMGAAAGKRT